MSNASFDEAMYSRESVRCPIGIGDLTGRGGGESVQQQYEFVLLIFRGERSRRCDCGQIHPNEQIELPKISRLKGARAMLAEVDTELHRDPYRLRVGAPTERCMSAR